MARTQQDLEERKDARLGMLVAAIASASVLVVGAYVSEFGTSLSPNREHWGQFGDYLGGLVNPLVGIVTLMLVFVTYRAQKKELRLTREALDL